MSTYRFPRIGKCSPCPRGNKARLAHRTLRGAAPCTFLRYVTKNTVYRRLALKTAKTVSKGDAEKPDTRNAKFVKMEILSGSQKRKRVRLGSPDMPTLLPDTTPLPARGSTALKVSKLSTGSQNTRRVRTLGESEHVESQNTCRVRTRGE